MSLSMAIQFLIFILPLIYLPNVFNPYESPKFAFFVTVVFILFLLNLKAILRKMTTSKMDALTKLVLLYGFIVYLADLLGLDPRTSFLGSQFRHQGFITLLAGICLFLVVRYNNYNSYKIYKDYIRWILLGGFLVSLFALWQGIAFHIFHDLSIPTYQGRIVGTLGNPNSLAGYLAMVLPFVLFNKNKIIKLVLSLMVVVVVIFADSRSAFLAVGFIFIVYGARLLLKLNISKIARGFVIFSVLIGIVQFTNYYIHKGIVNKQISAIAERGCPESWPIEYPLKIISDIYNSKIFHASREAPCDNRLLIGVVGLETLSKRPILGFGQENFEIAIPTGKMHSVDNAHNIFLETAMSSGIVGLLIFLGIIIVAFRKANFTIKMSLLAFLIIAQFNPLSITEISLFWFLLGLDKKYLYM